MVSSPLCDLAPVAPDIVLGLFSREGEADRAAVLLAGPQRLCREIRVVGSVGKSLHMYVVNERYQASAKCVISWDAVSIYWMSFHQIIVQGGNLP